MFTYLWFRGGASTRCRHLAVTAVALTALLFTSLVQAQGEGHGIALRKVCDGPVAVCSTDADCNDGNQCTADQCDPGDIYLDILDCEITATYNDTFGDNVLLTDLWDVIETADGDITIPANAGEGTGNNLPIIFVSGNTTCTIDGDLPCTIGPANNDFPTSGLVVFSSNSYKPKSNDPANLYDEAQSRAVDQCDTEGVPDPLCPADLTIRATAVGISSVVDGCENPNLPESTPCDNEDGDACTTSGCDGAGTCDPLHNVVTCDEPGVCEDDNVCDSDPESPTAGQCVPVYSAESTPCDNEDGDECTVSGCDGAGTCDPNHILLPCGDAVCRTPGFWSVRGGHPGDEDYKHGDNITGEVLGDGLEICGLTLTNTDLANNQSAIEAMCINKGDPQAKLLRHLTASALNCELSNCGANTAALVEYCSDVCADNDDGVAISMCSSSLDCFNNGGYILEDGSCIAYGDGQCADSGGPCETNDDCPGTAFEAVEECLMYESCHNRSLCEDGSNFCFEPPGPASGPKKCNQARKDGTYIWDYPPPVVP